MCVTRATVMIVARFPAALALMALLVGSWLPMEGLSAPGWAASEKRVCRTTCKRRTRTCLDNARRERAARVTACKSAAERRKCLAAQKGAFRRSKQACRSLSASCRTCCRTATGPCAGEEPVFGGTFPVPDRHALDTLPLPPGPNGTGFTWLATADGAIVIDPTRRSPVSAAAECAAFVVACFRPGVRNWGGCFDNAPPCPTDTPFLEDGPVCCPAACSTRYQALRQKGVDGPTAVTAAIWDAPSCIPGLAGRDAEVAP